MKTIRRGTHAGPLRRWIAACFAAGLISAAPAASPQEQTAAMSLEACILEALRNNLGVAIEVITPRLSALSFEFAKEKYIPSLSVGLTESNTSSASFSWIEAAALVTSDDQTYSAQLSEFVPLGGRFYATLSSYKSESNRSYLTINPRYGSTLTFTYWQPLLRNFGLGLNRRDIVIARNNLDISEVNFRAVLQNTIYSVEQAYWNLVYAVENLKVRRQSLALAKDLLAKNTREAEVGTIAPIEVLNAEAEVATREADILQAESQVASTQDSLATILNLPRREGQPRLARVIPTDQPAFEARPLDFDASLQTAMENRSDLQATRLDLQNKELTYRYLRNQLLPDLSLNASYWSPGVSGTQILYQDDDPLTNVIIGTIPGGASGSLNDAFRLRYRNWSISLSLSIPINYYLSRSHFAQIQISRDQALLRLQYLEQQVYLEIRNAVRDVETNFKRVQAYKLARELAERRLQAEEKKLKVGLTTNYLVLLNQRDLDSAKTNELKALIDYNLSLSSLERSLGTSLRTKGIRIGDIINRDQDR
ncbi:MAG: TolC family protein [Acidobacteriota bacterium]|nr:TolC family protein [Acidobacteriota bacterium]